METVGDRLRSVIMTSVTLIGLGALWQLFVSAMHFPVLLLPGPADVWNAAIEEREALLAAALYTAAEIAFAVVLSVIGGFVTAVALCLLPAMRRAVFPYVLATQVVPKVALAPILVAWMGIGAPMRLALAFLIAYFPMVINTLSGLVGTERAMIVYAQSLAASELQTLIKVRLPAALPVMIGGLKITTALAVIGVVVGEFVATDRGLGKVIIESIALLQTPLTIAATALIALIGLALLGIVELLERRVVYWHAGR